MRILSEKWARLREIFFARNCAVCGKILVDSREAYYGLCSACHNMFPIDNSRRCKVCGKPLISERELCISCRKSGPYPFDAAITVYPYIGKYQTLLKAYKFGKHKPLARFLAEKMLAAVKLFSQPVFDAVWTPVPPRHGKLKSAGWDQIEELARILEKNTGSPQIKVVRSLKRLPSKIQKELNQASRRVNLQGKIIAVRQSPPNVILFDDVFTTGSTLAVCAETLKKAGAKQVWGLSLFYN